MEILPDGFRSVVVDGARVVVGPAGAFVLADGGDDPVATGDRVVSLTHSLRSILATQLTWVPFIDPIVVVDDDWDDEAAGAATSVPADLLAPTILYGAGRLDPAAADHIVAAAEQLAGRHPR